MGARVEVRITAAPIDSAAETAALTRGETDAGALAAFTGFCRDEGGRLEALELEHYPGMAERQIEMIALEACTRFGLLAALAVHRHGLVRPGEVIVFVGALSRHRQAAFDGAAFMMDFLKTEAPFWKKEHRRDGATAWVTAKDADDRAKDKWRG